MNESLEPQEAYPLMPSPIAAAVQMTSTDDIDNNLANAQRLIRQAAARNASLVVLPELFTVLGSPESITAGAQSVPGGALR